MGCDSEEALAMPRSQKKKKPVPESVRPGTTFAREIRKLFDLAPGQATPEQVIMDIANSAELRSSNLWVLLLAILIASVGLNVNSSAVVIGAMLISPLMGPIMAAGLGVAIHDFDLMRRGGISLALAAVASILVSTIYFTLSPLEIAGNELLARTSPTAWDALIAFCGGLAGAVGITRVEKTNVLPGVAIATALMPPLCTAGYGIATGNFGYFAGALYLFYVNSICIALGTLIICRALHYPRISYLDPTRRRRVRRTIAIVILVSILPSAYFGYNLVRKTIFEKNARAFIEREVGAENAQILSKTISFDARRIVVVVLGKPLGVQDHKRLAMRLADYGLAGVALEVRSGLDFQAATAADPGEKEQRDREERQLKQLLAEMEVIFPGVKGVAATRAPLVAEGKTVEQVTLVYVSGVPRTVNSERARMVQWLEARTGTRVKLITD